MSINRTVPGTSSVIIPCWNQLDFTRQCISALMRHTRAKWELIVIDNGSVDGTAAYLADLQNILPLPVTLITNAKNRGFPAAINQGLECARGEYLVLLNNDVVVTEGWLEQLIALTSTGGITEGDGAMNRRMFTTEGTEDTEFETAKRGQFIEVKDAYPGRNITVIDLAPGRRESAESRIGIVGPMSNYAAPPQLVEDVPFRDLGALEVFARQWRDDHRGKWTRVPKLSGFCLLMKRAVYEAIGGLDERFGLGFFDDDDLAERARRAGFELAVAHDLFVHHFGSRTFVGNGVDAEKLLDENAARFAAKWGDSVPRGVRVALKPFSVNPQRGADRLGAEISGGNEAAAGLKATNQGSGIQDHGPQKTPRGADGGEGEGGSGRCGELARAELVTPAREPLTPAPSPGEREACAPISSRALPSHLRLSASSVDETLRPRSVSSADRARVSLTMIVRDEQANLPRALESVRGVFDEIVIVDTGSRDRTVEIACSFGARVFHFTWIDDFAAARNAALAHATGDYAFWLDADDLIEPAERTKLEALFDRLRDSTQKGAGTGIPGRSQSPFASAFVVRCACDPAPGASGGDTIVDHVRLFPILDGVRWTYKVHEQILPALRRARVPVQWTDITVRHTGYADRAVRTRKLERDTRILLGELGERPNDPFVLFNLGMIAVERKEWTDALVYLKRSLASSAPADSITRKLFALIARVHEMLGDIDAALRACALGLTVEPDDAELWFRKGVAHRHRGEPDEAERAWRQVLTLRRPEKFASMDQGIYGHVTRRNLAVLVEERGDRAEAERLWRAILAECPGDGDALRHLGDPRNDL